MLWRPPGWFCGNTAIASPFPGRQPPVSYYASPGLPDTKKGACACLYVPCCLGVALQFGFTATNSPSLPSQHGGALPPVQSQLVKSWQTDEARGGEKKNSMHMFCILCFFSSFQKNKNKKEKKSTTGSGVSSDLSIFQFYSIFVFGPVQKKSFLSPE